MWRLPQCRLPEVQVVSSCRDNHSQVPDGHTESRTDDAEPRFNSDSTVARTQIQLSPGHVDSVQAVVLNSRHVRGLRSVFCHCFLVLSRGDAAKNSMQATAAAFRS